MENTTSTEFVEWVEYLDREELEGFHRDDYNFAQLAKVMVECWSKGKKHTTEDFLLKFRRAGEVKEKKKPNLKAEKAVWFSLLGMKEKA